MEKLKFLFVPIDGIGHINAFMGVGQELLKKGHEMTFAISHAWIGKLSPLGFKERCYDDAAKEDFTLEVWGEMVQTMKPALEMEPMPKLEHFNCNIYKQLLDHGKATYPKLVEIIGDIKPHLILVDCVYNPALCEAGIPWMFLCPINPIGLATDNVAPPFSGYTNIDPDKTQWDAYRKKMDEILGPLFKEFRAWSLELGGTVWEYDYRAAWVPNSPYGSLYMFPQELDYTMHRPYPPNYHQFDALPRSEPEPFEIPTKLKDLPGKLIYFSLGTIGCSELILMRRLIGIFSKSPHRFIVSKGPLADQLELADNMWGASSVPQTNVLPIVDLIITHGGNNTITESFYFGTKVLVLPLFCDQADNGRRVEETGLGLQFEPYKVTENELLNGIETLLADDLLERRMKTISLRIKAANNCKRAADLVENVAINNTRL